MNQITPAISFQRKSHTSLLHHFHFNLPGIVLWGHLVAIDLYTSAHTQKVLFMCQVFSHFMPINTYQYRKSSHFISDFLKLNLFQNVFISIFSSVHVNKYYLLIFSTFFNGANLFSVYPSWLKFGLDSWLSFLIAEIFFFLTMKKSLRIPIRNVVFLNI